METETKSPTRMGKLELKDSLLGLGYTEDQLQDAQGKWLKRPELLTILQDHKKGENDLTALSEAEEDDDDIGIVVESDAGGSDVVADIGQPINSSEDKSDVDADYPEEIDPPTPNDPGWTQFVLGKFLEDEVEGKNPRVEGLRRVAGELVGELLEEGCDLVAAPTEENRFRACVKAWGVFLTPEGRTKRFEALADAHSDNCFEDYATYLVAMADTRAKGRVFRNALCLRKIVSAEEVSKTVSTTADVQRGGAIHTGQISLIRLMSEHNNFNIEEVLKDLGIEHKLNDKTGDVNLQSLTYEDALMTAKKMREMKEEKEKGNE